MARVKIAGEGLPPLQSPDGAQVSPPSVERKPPCPFVVNGQLQLHPPAKAMPSEAKLGERLSAQAGVPYGPRARHLSVTMERRGMAHCHAAPLCIVNQPSAIRISAQLNARTEIAGLLTWVALPVLKPSWKHSITIGPQCKSAAVDKWQYGFGIFPIVCYNLRCPGG